MNKKLVLQGLVSAVCEVVYIAVVTQIMAIVPKLFGEKPDGVLAPVLFLTLLVLSVSVSGALIFGRAILLYLDGKKKESVKVFGYTIGWLMILVALIFLGMFFVK